MDCAGWGLSHRPGAWALHLSGGSAEHGRQILQLRYGGHALGGEHAAALQLPVLDLLQQHRPTQAGNPGVVGEDADDIGCGGLSSALLSAPLGATFTSSNWFVLQTFFQC